MDQARVTFTDVRNAGPPQRHMDFPPPNVHLANRKELIYYDIEAQEFFQHESIIRVDKGGDDSIAEQAYLVCSQNARKKTQMGEICICRVLARSEAEEGGYDSENLDSDDSDSDANVETVFHTTDKWVAVKISSKRAILDRLQRPEGHSENPWQEISAAQFIGNNHPNLLSLVDALEDDDFLYTVMPYYPDGDLCDYIEKHKGRSVDEARKCFVQIILGLQQLQTCGICHRDLSIENILLDGNRCIIIDFGMSLRVPLDQDGMRRLILPVGAPGKTQYMAPEIFANRLSSRYAFDGFSCDLWAAGVILFVLLTGKFPYSQPDTTDIGFCWVINNVLGVFQEWGISINPSAADLLQNIFQLHPMHRITLGQVLDHPWIRNTTI